MHTPCPRCATLLDADPTAATILCGTCHHEFTPAPAASVPPPMPPDPPRDRRLICGRCEAVATIRWVSGGSVIIEFGLYLLALASGALGLFRLLDRGDPTPAVGAAVMVGLALIYSSDRSRHAYLACTRCQSPELIPADSPRGRRLQAQS